MDNEVMPLPVQKIVGRLARTYQISLQDAYTIEDLYQEGWLLWLEIKDIKAWEGGNHRYRFFQTSFKNHLNDLYTLYKARIRPFVQDNLFAANNGIFAVSLQQAPKIIVHIGEAISRVLAARREPTNNNVCKELKWSSAHINAVITFKNYMTGKNNYGEKVRY